MNSKVFSHDFTFIVICYINCFKLNLQNGFNLIYCNYDEFYF